MNTTPQSNRFKKAIVAGLIGLTAIGATAIVPSVAQAQDGTELSQEERDALRAERQADREARREAKVTVLTDALGISADELQAAREDGQSIAAIATANGVSVESVVEAIVEAKTAQIQAKVDAGDLDQAEANEKIAGLAESVTERVNSEPGERGDGEGRRGRRGNGGGGNAEPASA